MQTTRLERHCAPEAYEQHALMTLGDRSQPGSALGRKRETRRQVGRRNTGTSATFIDADSLRKHSLQPLWSLPTMPRKPNYDFDRRRKEQERKTKTDKKRAERQQRRDEQRVEDAPPPEIPEEK
jgi:hypothetical protein